MFRTRDMRVQHSSNCAISAAARLSRAGKCIGDAAAQVLLQSPLLPPLACLWLPPAALGVQSWSGHTLPSQPAAESSGAGWPHAHLHSHRNSHRRRCNQAQHRTLPTLFRAAFSINLCGTKLSLLQVLPPGLVFTCHAQIVPLTCTGALKAHPVQLDPAVHWAMYAEPCTLKSRRYHAGSSTVLQH